MKESSEHKKIIYLGGISGSGKTTLTHHLVEQLPQSGALYFSSSMRNHFNSRSYEELDKVSDTKQRRARIQIYQEFVTKPGLTKYVIDGHYLLFGRSNIPTPCVDDEWARDVSVFFHIVVDPEVALERMGGDDIAYERRIKNLVKIPGESDSLLDRIKFTQGLSLDAASEVAKKTKKPLYIVDNSGSVTSALRSVIGRL